MTQFKNTKKRIQDLWVKNLALLIVIQSLSIDKEHQNPNHSIKTAMPLPNAISYMNQIR